MNLKSLDGTPVMQIQQLVGVINYGNQEHKERAMMASCFLIHYVVDYLHLLTCGTSMATVFAILCERECGVGQGALIKKRYMKKGISRVDSFTTADIYRKFLWRGDNGTKKRWRRYFGDNCVEYALTKSGIGQKPRDTITTFFVYTKEHKRTPIRVVRRL